jgi:predicted phosphodiesterase
MTTVSVMSDLHLEFADIELPGGDILLLAGDVFVAASLRHEVSGGGLFQTKQRAIRFCEEELKKYKHVLHVSGNHEHYHGCVRDTSELIRRFLKKHAPHAVHLNNKSIDIEDVRFIGSTLWATYGHETPAAYKIEWAMNDFDLIKIPNRRTGTTRRVRPADLAKLHKRAVSFIREELDKAKGASVPCVLVTHHAPSYLSQYCVEHPRGDTLQDAYYSNQHALIEENPHLKAVFHGHTHDNCHYRIGETLVVSNQRGYFPNERCACNFNPNAEDFELDEIKK